MYNDWNRALSAKSSSTLLLLHLSLCCSKMHIRMYFVYECVVFCYGSRSRWLHPCACVWLWHACTCRSVWHHTHCGVVSCSGLLPNWVVPLFMRISLPSRALFPFFPPFPLPQTGPKGVLSDYRRFEQVQKQEADHEKQEQLAQMQREAVTCRSAVSERRLDSVHTVLCTMGLGWAEVWRDVGYKTLTLFCSWRRPSWLKHRTIVHYCYVCECSASQVCLPWHEPLQQEMATTVILVS